MTGLRRIGAPKVAMLLAALVFALPGLDWSPTDHCELFAGEMAITRAELEAGRRAVAFDVRYDSLFMNFNGDCGYCHAIYQVLRLIPGGGLMIAPVCSSWIFMSRGSTKRSKYNARGNPSAPSVQQGNLMAARTAILLYLAAARGVWFVLEQPSGSLFQEHPRIQQLLRILKLRKKLIHMLDFGGFSSKPTWLYSSPATSYLSINSFGDPTTEALQPHA
ncbi:unnamed protein product [Symbiodinium sp. CCMP2592]|nr:unnamed protein product [Symbiodinium sp. CCMP2592]